MYFSTLKTRIQNIDAVSFYDIAAFYLTARGYRDVSIIDGTGDGGRDVTCSNKNLRIQLSVRKDWKIKINKEAETAHNNGESHLIYITNRIISESDEASFFANSFAYEDIEVSIHDVNKIVSLLSQPRFARKAYEMANLSIPIDLKASPKDIALSTILLFSDEAKELYKDIVESNIKAIIFKEEKISEDNIVNKVEELFGGKIVSKTVRSALSRLRGAGKIFGSKDNIALSKDEYELVCTANADFLNMFDSDVELLSRMFCVDSKDARDLLNAAVGLLVKERPLEGDGQEEESLRQVLCRPIFRTRKADIYAAISQANIARFKQRGKYIAEILEANTFDIYRTLGRKTQITMVLDSSVAMPVLFGLEYGDVNSRYGMSAKALRDICERHEIQIVIPDCYCNEMASHGIGAIDKIKLYNDLPQEAKVWLKGSGNAYLSHFYHISESSAKFGQEISLHDFLKHFGIVHGCSIMTVENRIYSLLENNGISILKMPPYQHKIREAVAEKKGGEPPVIINHDAQLITVLRTDCDHGYVFATWDRALIKCVENLSRVLADTPSRIIDSLSIARGADYQFEESQDVLSSLLYVDDSKLVKFAELIDNIKSETQVHKLTGIIDVYRSRGTSISDMQPEMIAPFLDIEE